MDGFGSFTIGPNSGPMGFIELACARLGIPTPQLSAGPWPPGTRRFLADPSGGIALVGLLLLITALRFCPGGCAPERSCSARPQPAVGLPSGLLALQGGCSACRTQADRRRSWTLAPSAAGQRRQPQRLENPGTGCAGGPRANSAAAARALVVNSRLSGRTGANRNIAGQPVWFTP